MLEKWKKRAGRDQDARDTKQMCASGHTFAFEPCLKVFPKMSLVSLFMALIVQPWLAWN